MWLILKYLTLCVTLYEANTINEYVKQRVLDQSRV